MKIMKHTLLLLTAFFLFPAVLMCQQDSSWFTVREVAKDVWQINDGGPNIYLIIGHDSALVVDTGNGAADLAGQIIKMTDKPLIVLNTHGHGDHTGANYQFEKVYVHEADLEVCCRLRNGRKGEFHAEKYPRDGKAVRGRTF